MQLETRSYSKEFSNLLIKILNNKKIKASEDDLKNIEKHIFILKHRIVSEYNKIRIEVEDNILDRQDISINTSEFVKKTLCLFFVIDGFLKNGELIGNESNHKLTFRGFDDHDDIEEFYGAVNYAEYLLDYEEKYLIFKNVFREGTSSDTYRYVEALEFFEGKEIDLASIKEFINN